MGQVYGKSYLGPCKMMPSSYSQFPWGLQPKYLNREKNPSIILLE